MTINKVQGKKLLKEADAQKKIAERELKLLEKGFKMGKFKFKSRAELYER